MGRTGPDSLFLFRTNGRRPVARSGRTAGGRDGSWPRQHSISIRGNMNNRPRCGPRSKNAAPRADVHAHARTHARIAPRFFRLLARDSYAIYTIHFDFTLLDVVYLWTFSDGWYFSFFFLFFNERSNDQSLKHTKKPIGLNQLSFYLDMSKLVF